MTFFKLDKNPRHELNTPDDYSLYAKRCFKQAKSFAGLCINNLNMLMTEQAMAILANMCFACELYFKYFLFFLQIQDLSFKKKHSLYELFKLLPIDLQEQIINNHPYSKTRSDFELNLLELAQGFIEFRYSYEKDSFAVNMKFLVGLLTELYERTTEIE